MYKRPEFEVVELEAEDILTASLDGGVDDDIWTDDGKGDDTTKDDDL